MKTKIISFIVGVIILTGCKSDHTQISEIQNKFPNCEIRQLQRNDAGNLQWVIKTPDNKYIYVYFDEMCNLTSYQIF
jgi:hypothetical protein